MIVQYYWAVSDWGACSAACDGGAQMRAVSCMNALDGSCVMLASSLSSITPCTGHTISCIGYTIRDACLCWVTYLARGCVDCQGVLLEGIVTACNWRMRRQAGALLCDAASKPANRQPCGLTACALTQRQLRLSFSAWGACEAACGSGFNSRAPICADEDGVTADAAACAGYKGGPFPFQFLLFGNVGHAV